MTIPRVQPTQVNQMRIGPAQSTTMPMGTSAATLGGIDMSELMNLMITMMIVVMMMKMMTGAMGGIGSPVPAKT